MAYRKRFEDSYLDEEDEEFDGVQSPVDRLIILLQKKTKTDKDRMLIEKYAGMIEGAEVWARIAEVAEAVGDKDFYYIAIDKMTGV